MFLNGLYVVSGFIFTFDIFSIFAFPLQVLEPKPLPKNRHCGFRIFYFLFYFSSSIRSGLVLIFVIRNCKIECTVEETSDKIGEVSLT